MAENTSKNPITLKGATAEGPIAASDKAEACPETELSTLTANALKYLPPQTADDLRAAYEFAANCHSNQRRHSGEPYITHPLAVANILTTLKVDAASLIAAILHDVVEDTEASLETIEKKFGRTVAELVDGMTKISKIKFRSNQERLAENFRKMILAMAKDLRVILIKLADRLHNMRTIDVLPKEKRVRIAQETLDIYAPLASRLGIYGIKSELEDLCLKELKQESYRSIAKKIAAKKAERETHIAEVRTIVENELKKYGFTNARVYGRPKHFYSIYKKMTERRLDFEDVHDLFAFRILVDSVKDCYEALGIVHAMWKPMPGRFKDYIAMPKANMYQSLHTTVIRPNGEPAEIQIRTYKMHEICEFGIAAHWAYKEKKPGSAEADDLKKFSWLRQMMEWQNEVDDPEEFLESVKVDLFENEIFVFTPKGDVFQLPAGATALDFAFAVHSDVGQHTTGAKVNGRMVAIKKRIESGDIVEILTSPNQKPSKDWLNFVSTSKARNKIRSFLRSEQRDKSKRLGHELLNQALEAIGLDYEKLVKSGDIESLVRSARDSGLDDLLISIGYGRINPKELVSRVFPERKAQQSDLLPQFASLKITEAKKGGSDGILVSGIDNVLVNFARCCNPLPGEDVTGFITRGRGVTVHRSTCVKAHDIDPRRKIDVQWSAGQHDKGQHAAYIRVRSHDKPGVLAEITQAISACGANILKAEIKVTDDLMGRLDFKLNLQNLDQLQNIVHKIEGIPEVVSVERRNILTTRKPKKGRQGHIL